MKRHPSRALALLPLLALLTPTFARAGEFLPATGKRVEGSYLVVFQPGYRSSVVAPQLVSLYRGGRTTAIWESAVNGAAISGLSDAQARELAKNPLVAWVEEDTVVSGLPLSENLMTRDYQSSPVWGLDRIDQRRLPLNNQYGWSPTSNGTGIRAYVIDSGIRITHTQFGTRASIGADFVGDGWNGDDCFGHGTHVAGILGGTTYGVAKQVQLISVRALDCANQGTAAGIVNAVNWVTANGQLPAVVNMSLGGGANVTIDTAVNNSVNAGFFYAIAAGNDNGANACNVSPARAAQAYTVGATQSNDARASYSNIGTCLNIFAPGSSILSASRTSDTATTTMSGTSMATPHVAGLAARILDENPAWTPAQVRNELTARATCGRVTNAGTGSPNLLAYRGYPDYRFEITVEAVLFAGRRASLGWGGSCVANVDIFRDGVKILTTPNDGAQMDLIGGSGPGSFNYWVCEAGSTTWYNQLTCSNVGTAYFP